MTITVFQQLVPACTILFFNFWCGYYLRAGTIWGLVNREGYYSFYHFRWGYCLRAGIIQGRVLIAEIRYLKVSYFHPMFTVQYFWLQIHDLSYFNYNWVYFGANKWESLFPSYVHTNSSTIKSNLVQQMRRIY